MHGLLKKSLDVHRNQPGGLPARAEAVVNFRLLHRMPRVSNRV